MIDLVELEARIDKLLAETSPEEFWAYIESKRKDEPQETIPLPYSTLREALEEIVSPIKFMQQRLQEGEKLDGGYAIALSKDPEYLKEIARKALNQLK